MHLVKDVIYQQQSRVRIAEVCVKKSPSASAWEMRETVSVQMFICVSSVKIEGLFSSTASLKNL